MRISGKGGIPGVGGGNCKLAAMSWATQPGPPFSHLRKKLALASDGAVWGRGHASFQDPGGGPADTHPRGVGGTPPGGLPTLKRSLVGVRVLAVRGATGMRRRRWPRANVCETCQTVAWRSSASNQVNYSVARPF